MKQLITILSITIVSLSYGQSINDSLLLYYPFSGTAKDASGNGFNGMVNATLTTDRFGNINEAYSFNGLNQYIDFPVAIELKPELPVSFSFWVKLDDLQPENTVLFTTDYAQDNHSGVWMNLSSTGFLAINYGDATGNTSTTNRRTKLGTTQLNTNVWYHVAGVVNGPTDMEIYVDCVNDNGSYQGTGGELGYTSALGSIGRKDANTTMPAYYFMGSMDEFRYWNRELSLNDIDSLCNNLFITTGEVDMSTTMISVYPNPVSDILNIEFENSLEFENIVIYNSMGQSVYKGLFQSQIKIDQLSSGVYFIQITKKKNEIAKMIRIVKE